MDTNAICWYPFKKGEIWTQRDKHIGKTPCKVGIMLPQPKAQADARREAIPSAFEGPHMAQLTP